MIGGRVESAAGRQEVAPVLRGRPVKRAMGEDILDTFPDEAVLKERFHEIWGALEEHMELSLTSEEALELFSSLVVYDIPDGTRSTLTVHPKVDVGMDAGLYCVALLHTLRSLGAPSCIIMTHTTYNRARGEEGMARILKIISRGSRPLKRYADRAGANVHWLGMKPGYELGNYLRREFPVRTTADFNAYFLIDYAEDLMEDQSVRHEFDRLPEIDVTIRHTKLNFAGGGWIPDKMLRSTFLYSQNGSLFSNWDFDELVALGTLSLLAKVLNSGEGLVKMYGDVDEVKRRYQLREIRLFNQRIDLRAQPRKLFVLGSALGLHQFYF